MYHLSYQTLRHQTLEYCFFIVYYIISVLYYVLYVVQHMYHLLPKAGLLFFIVLSALLSLYIIGSRRLGTWSSLFFHPRQRCFVVLYIPSATFSEFKQF